MGNTAQDILRKINYIEADMDIQKQILFSIPSAEKQEMEKVLKVIAGQKEKIDALRQEMKTAAPDEYEKILIFEKAAQKFKALAAEKQFKEITTFDGTTPCTISLKDGTIMDCLVKAQDDAGDWTALTLDGTIQTYPCDTVA
jgi:hypothetical protein